MATPDGREENAFERLEELARHTADELLRQKRPFDSYSGRLAGDLGTAKGLLGFIRFSARSSPAMTHPSAWRLHSMRLSETSSFALDAAGGVSEREHYARKDDELWLRSNGELFILAFRIECEDGKPSHSVASRPVTHLSAARYDYAPTWKTRQTTHGHASVEEGWLEILGKPWYQDPYESISRLLSSVSDGNRIPSGVPSAKPGDALP